MNKLFARILGVTVGFAMATGIGAGALLHNRNAERALASTSPIAIDMTTVSTTSYSDNALVWDYSELTVTASKESGTKVTNYWPGTSGQNYTQTRLYTGNKITFAPKSGYQIDSITITATTASYLKIGSTSTTTNGTVFTSGSTATITPTSKTANVVLTCDGTGRYTGMTVSFSAASTAPEMAFSKENLYVATTTEASLDVSYANLSNNISLSQSGSGSVKLSTDGETYTSSLTLDKSKTSPQTIYVKGITVGSVTLSASSGTLTKTCSVTVSVPSIYKKITKVGEIKDGGRFVLLATGTTKAVSKTQLSNGRNSTNVTIIDDDINLPSVPDAGVFTFSKGSDSYANYYTIFDPAYGDNGGYLQYYNSNLTCYYVSTTPTSDAFYWSVSISNDHVVLENKANANNYLEYNSSADLFRLYAGTQTKLDLYELESDIPSGTALTSITAANVTVGEGSTITYSGTYAPTNATENIVVSLGSNIATLGAVSMANGSFSFTIKGDTAGSTTMTLVGENGHGSKGVTLTVAAYTATHTLVTASSSLSNGAKVIFASQEEGEEYAVSAAAHTGGDFLPVVSTAFNADKTTLAAAATSKEYTIWCVDSTKGYYVFSDGGYFLCAPSSMGNKLQRSAALNERCYFTITNDADGVLITSQYSIDNEWTVKVSNVDTVSPYVIRYNSGSPRISLYGAASTSMKLASIYKSNQAVNAVQGFVDVFMHLENVATDNTEDTNACRDEGSGSKGYFAAALAGYNALSAAEKETFCTDAAYANAYVRLGAWASANGYNFSGYSLVQNARTSLINTNNGTMTVVIIVASFIALSSVGMFFIIRKRKEQR